MIKVASIIFLFFAIMSSVSPHSRQISSQRELNWRIADIHPIFASTRPSTSTSCPWSDLKLSDLSIALKKACSSSNLTLSAASSPWWCSSYSGATGPCARSSCASTTLPSWRPGRGTSCRLMHAEQPQSGAGKTLDTSCTDRTTLQQCCRLWRPRPNSRRPTSCAGSEVVEDD